HGARIGVTRPVEFVRAPGVILPVTPVLHDVVEGQTELPVLLDYAQELLLRLVMIPALPESIRPTRQQYRLTRKVTIAADHPIEARGTAEVVVDGLPGLRGEREPLALRLRKRIPVQQRKIPPLPVPFEPQRHRLSRRHPD